MSVSYLPTAAFSRERLRALWRMDRPDVFWRHDVDHDLGCAMAMAIHEYGCGITSTYYLRADDETYDARSVEFDMTAMTISAFGHELGVHVDLGLPRDSTPSDDCILSACEHSRLRLEHLPVGRRISFHKPPESVLWREVDGFEHALAERWYGRYVSDSRQRFRQSPEALLATDGPVQVNLHPLWWFMDPVRAERIRLEHEVAARIEELQVSL